VLLLFAVNASHHGYYDYGLNTATVGYDVWSYDMMFTPIRVVMRTSRDGCLALQDSALSLTKQSRCSVVLVCYITVEEGRERGRKGRREGTREGAR